MDNRWWYCTQCFAINDGLEQARCWNCDHYERKRKHFPWVEMGTEKCKVCRKPYVTWTLPAGTTLTVPDVMGLCRNYFDHYGSDAYFPPMLPLEYILVGNNWSYNEKTGKIQARRS